MSATPPVIFKTPDSNGSAAHPVLLALFYTFPQLAKTVVGSNTGPATLSCAVKKAWGSIGKSGGGDCKPVWDLIGSDRLVPADAAELLNQICDLFDAELDHAAENIVSTQVRSVFTSGARSKDLTTSAMGYCIPLALSHSEGNLAKVFSENFQSVKADYMFTGDDEPVEGTRSFVLGGKFNQGLVIHLQRYRFDHNIGGNAKVYNRLEFPETLAGKDLAAFAHESCASAIAESNFDLVAVVTHADEDGYGLFLRPDGKGPWWRCCHAENNGAPVQADLTTLFGGEETSHDLGYLLFYKLSDGTSAAPARKMSIVRKMSITLGLSKPNKS